MKSCSLILLLFLFISLLCTSSDRDPFIGTYILYTAYYKPLCPHELRQSSPCHCDSSPWWTMPSGPAQRCLLNIHPSFACTSPGAWFHLTALPICGVPAENPQSPPEMALWWRRVRPQDQRTAGCFDCD